MIRVTSPMCIFFFFFLSFFIYLFFFFFFFQAEDGIRDLVRSRGLGDVYKRQAWMEPGMANTSRPCSTASRAVINEPDANAASTTSCLLYTSDAADERSSVDLGGRRIIKKKNREGNDRVTCRTRNQ